MNRTTPIDDKEHPLVCDCEFQPYHDDMECAGTESWHYLRRCRFCDYEWWGLHCPHDGYQNPCPRCNKTPMVMEDLS